VSCGYIENSLYCEVPTTNPKSCGKSHGPNNDGPRIFIIKLVSADFLVGANFGSSMGSGPLMTSPDMSKVGGFISFILRL